MLFCGIAFGLARSPVCAAAVLLAAPAALAHPAVSIVQNSRKWGHRGWRLKPDGTEPASLSASGMSVGRRP
jgi:hypothetical protein